MSASNKAAWIAEKGARTVVGEAPYLQVEDNGVIIKNAAVAMNGLDFKMQDDGLMVKAWPLIVGLDVAGEVVEVGKNVRDIQRGQRVLGKALSLTSGDHAAAGYQLYTSVPSNAVTPIPDSMDFPTAAVLPVSVSCAAAGLYEKSSLGLPLPSANPPKARKIILVWGGSSSVGSSTIQLARASGIEVVATASPKNFEYVKKLGASAVFDYSQPDIVDKLAEALKDGNCAGAYDTVGTNFAQCAAVLEKLGGGHVAGVLPPQGKPPANVTFGFVLASSVNANEIGAAIYNDYLPKALANGSFVPFPKPTVVGHGLEHVQAGIDQLKKGVSATKLVVTL